MRARIKFTIDFQVDSLKAELKEAHWLRDDSNGAREITAAIRQSLESGDTAKFDATEKIAVLEGTTETQGTISDVDGVWVLRLLNNNLHLLQFACESFIEIMTDYAQRNGRKFVLQPPIQIVEIHRKETIIQGHSLATSNERRDYARKHKKIEFGISVVGSALFVILLIATFPWPFRNLQDPQESWAYSVLEKLIGSVAVTTLIAVAQYWSFRRSLKTHTINWSIPGKSEQHEIRPTAS